MNILMLLENDFSGDIRVAREIVSLTGAGHYVILAAVTGERGYRTEDKGTCVIHRKHMPELIRKSSVGALKFPFYFNFWRRYIRQISAGRKIDAIHVHDLPLSITGIEFSKRTGAKLVIDLHENWPALLEISKHINTLAGKLLSSDRMWRRYEKECLGKADRIITVVEEMKERIAGTGIGSDKIIVLENTPLVNEAMIPEKTFTGDPLRVIYVGGLTWHRGIQTVIKGISALSDLNIQFDIAGDGSYLKDLKKLAADLSLNDRVFFHGKLPRKEAEKLLAGSDVAVIPHLRSEQGDNSSPNKLYEYMAAGIPVLASDCRSVKRIIEETGCGTTYIFDSPDDFAEKLSKLFNERKLLNHFSANGLKACRDKYNWNRSSETLLELYSNLR